MQLSVEAGVISYLPKQFCTIDLPVLTSPIGKNTRFSCRPHFRLENGEQPNTTRILRLTV
jgi:hypothetical protein